jgi:DNA mismatch repair ATPase MutS
MVDYILKKGSKVVLATHYFEMFAFNSSALDFYTFKIMDDEEMTFLYELMKGRCEKSLGILCAIRGGLNETMVERGTLDSSALTVAEAIHEHAPIPVARPNQEKDLITRKVVELFMVSNLDYDIESELWTNVRKLIKNL